MKKKTWIILIVIVVIGIASVFAYRAYKKKNYTLFADKKVTVTK